MESKPRSNRLSRRTFVRTLGVGGVLARALGSAGVMDQARMVLPTARCLLRRRPCRQGVAGVISYLWRHLQHLRDHIRSAGREAIHLIVQTHVGWIW
jgi:hypothetical protein